MKNMIAVNRRITNIIHQVLNGQEVDLGVELEVDLKVEINTAVEKIDIEKRKIEMINIVDLDQEKEDGQKKDHHTEIVQKKDIDTDKLDD